MDKKKIVVFGVSYTIGLVLGVLWSLDRAKNKRDLEMMRNTLNHHEGWLRVINHD